MWSDGYERVSNEVNPSPGLNLNGFSGASRGLFYSLPVAFDPAESVGPYLAVIDRDAAGQPYRFLDMGALIATHAFGENDPAAVQAVLDATTARMDTLEESSRAELPELQQRLVDVYKLGQARYLRLLLSTPDLRRLGQSTRTVAALAKLDRDRIATHAKTLAELTK